MIMGHMEIFLAALIATASILGLLGIGALHVPQRLNFTPLATSLYQGLDPSFNGLQDSQNCGSVLIQNIASCNGIAAPTANFGSATMSMEYATPPAPNPLAGNCVGCGSTPYYYSTVQGNFGAGVSRDSTTPTNSYVWTINGQEYQMDDYASTWSLNLYLTPYANNWQWKWLGYNNVVVWMKLTSQAFNYFSVAPDGRIQPADTVFFAPGSIVVKSGQWVQVNPDGSQKVYPISSQTGTCAPPQGTPDSSTPCSLGEATGIYFAPSFGAGYATVDQTKTFYSYKNATLNPQVFQPAYYVPITLTLKPWTNCLFFNPCDTWQEPSLNLVFQVHVFVVGQWAVPLPVTCPPGQTGPNCTPIVSPHAPNAGYTWLDNAYFTLTQWLGSPATAFFLLLALIAVIIFSAAIVLSRLGIRRNHS